MDVFWAWVWARHHNVLSWYIRPLFMLPYAWFAYRRSVAGLVLTVLALLTSMFWFPTPDRVEPWVADFLAAEQAYLLGPWTPTKVLWTLTIPLYFALIAVALWRRSWVWGVVVLAAGALGKVAWSVLEAGPSGWATAAPALIGLVLCVAAVLAGRWVHGRRATDSARHRGHR